VGLTPERFLDQAKRFAADDLQLPVRQHEFFKDFYFSFSYGSAYHESGCVGGAF